MASSARIDELKQKFDENPRRYFAPLANEYRKAGDLEQAIQLCRAYLPQNAGHMSGHIVFGQALFESGQYDEARTVFETALGLDPENLIALRHLGDIAQQAGDHATARQWYQRVLDADPRNEEMAQVLASLPATPPPAAPAAAGDAGGGMAGWGDINPERKDAGAQGAGASAGGGEAGLQLRDSLSVPVVTPAPATAGQGAQKLDLERDGEGAFAPPNPDAAVRTHPELERSEEIDLRSARPPEPSPLAGVTPAGANVADAALAGLELIPAEGQPDAAPAPTHMDQSFGSSNAMGFEVMEFVPPARDTDAPAEPSRGQSSYSGPFTGETRASDETPAAFVTETMAELYLQQGFTQEALGVYRQLLAQNPRDEGLRERVAALEAGSRSSVGAADVSAKVLEQAQRRNTREPETVRAFFAALMRRRVLQRYDEEQGHLAPEETQGADIPASAWSASETAQATAAPDTEWRDDTGEHQGSDDAFIVPEGAAPPPGVTHAEEIEAGDSTWDVPGRAPADVHAESQAHAREPEPEPLPAYEADTFEPASNGAGDSSAAESAMPVPPPAPVHAGTIDRLFDGAVPPADEQAAGVLSGAFPVVATTAISGRPAEPATTELSLDHVFREADRKSGRASGGFSFDQFFSEGGNHGQSGAGRPTDPSGKSVGGPDLPTDDDVAQFNDWLTGLKKK